MKNLAELKTALENNVPLVWDDPDPIPGNDYTITYVEPITPELEEDFDNEFPILIQYGEGSEAEVYLDEILIK